MKSLFNTSWKGSVQPRKQRKFLANAPNHIRINLMGSTLDKELRKKHGQRSISVRKGDEVKVLRGKFSKKQGAIIGLDRRKSKIQIEGLNITKKNGDKVLVWFHPSNVKVIKLEDSDKRRFKNSKPKQGEEKKNAN